MHVHIIHLPHRKDRLELLNTELKEQNIKDYTIWDGIVNENLSCKGICQAHKQIVAYAKRNKQKEILIAEDDLKFTAKGAFQYFLKNKPAEFDIYLASIYFGEIFTENRVKDFSGLTFYIVRESFFDVFLKLPENNNLDRSLNGKGNYVVCDPFTVIQYDGFSDNLKEYCNYNNYLKNRDLFR